MGKPRLILHIGVHKTGTTALQDTLARNRELLARHSIWYARTDRPPFPEHAKHGSFFRAALRGGDKLQREIAILSEELQQSGCETLVLSEEGFSEPKFAKFASLAGCFSDFDVKIYCNLRRQDYLIESLWNQHCKFRDETRTIEDFAFDFDILNRCRFKPLLDFWSTLGEVIALDYDQVKLSGIIRPVGELLGVDIEQTVERKNVSPGMNCALVLGELNNLGQQDYKPRIIRAFRDDTRKYALGSMLRKRLLKYFHADNAALAATYGVVFSDDLPLEDAQPLRSLDTAVVTQAMRRLCDQK